MSARILAIDDEENILELYSLIFSTEGYNVIPSLTTYDDLAEIEQIHPDVIILDLFIGTGKHHGWDFLHQLKKYAHTASIPLIVCTASARDIQEKAEYLKGIGVHVLSKPFDIDELTDMVQRVLSASSSSIL